MREDWIESTLGEVCFTTSGGTPSRQNKDFYNGNIPWVKSGELDKGIIYDSEEHISKEAIKKSSAKIFPKGTLLFALYGATIGKMATLGVDAATNQAICGIYKSDAFNSEYLYHNLFFQKNFLIQQGIGGAQPNISQTILKKLNIPIPPLVEQKAIVKKIEELFSSLHSGIADLKKAQDQLVIYRQAVLKKAFEGELTKEWREKQTKLPSADELLEQIETGRQIFYNNQIEEWEIELKKWKEKGEVGKKPKKPRPLTIPDAPNNGHNERKWNIPSDWVWTQIGSLCFVTKLAGFEYTDYVNYVEDGDLPVLKAENAGTNGFKKTDFSKVKSESVKMLKRSQIFGGELLIVFVGAGTGNVAMVPFNQRYFLGPNIGMARPYFDLNSKYLELFLQSAFGKSLMMSAVKAVAQPSLSMGTIRQAPIAFPSLKEQHQIVQEIESRLSVCDTVEKDIADSLEKAQALRQSILKKAFEGKLLSEEEIKAYKKHKDYQPASVLLEKIKAEKKQK